MEHFSLRSIKSYRAKKEDLSLDVFYAFLSTLIAGLCTGIGSCIAFFTGHTNRKFLAASLGFSAGVMIYVSLTEIFFKARDALTAESGERAGSWLTAAAFFGGILAIAMIDHLIPSVENPYEPTNPGISRRNSRLMRMGLFTALALAVHNFPEGLATFMASMENVTLGVSIAVAVAIHNIPEGIAVAIPIYYATKNKWKALLYATLSGLTEPFGAAACYAVASVFGVELTGGSAAFPLILAAVAGIMIYISLDELLPTAEKYGKHHVAIGGVVAGMAIMGFSLLLM